MKFSHVLIITEIINKLDKNGWKVKKSDPDNKYMIFVNETGEKMHIENMQEFSNFAADKLGIVQDWI